MSSNYTYNYELGEKLYKDIWDQYPEATKIIMHVDDRLQRLHVVTASDEEHIQPYHRIVGSRKIVKTPEINEESEIYDGFAPLVVGQKFVYHEVNSTLSRARCEWLSEKQILLFDLDQGKYRLLFMDEITILPFETNEEKYTISKFVEDILPFNINPRVATFTLESLLDICDEDLKKNILNTIKNYQGERL